MIATSSKSQLIRNASILLDGTFRQGLSIYIERRVIRAIGENIQPANIAPDQIIDLQGGYVVPRMIDLQVYGTEGHYFGGEPSVSHLAGMEKELIRQGVGGFLATIATNTNEIVMRAIESAKAYRRESRGVFLGLHLEGPFLNPAKKGAHPAELIRKASLAEINEWLDLADGTVKMMTVAPELQDEAVLATLKERGVTLSVGHSNATYEEAMGFLNRDITTATHLFNAMPPLHHRKPGLIMALFEKKSFSSIIPDGIHVSYPMLSLAKRELGDKLFLITDAVASATEGVYQHQLRSDHYETPEGILSGSAISMLQGVQNCIHHAGIEPEEAFRMATSVPAAVIGLKKIRGAITVGEPAEFLCLDKNFELLKDCLTFTA